MRFCVYILYSAQLGRHYTGQSHYRGKRRRQHVAGRSLWTSRADDWQEVWSTWVGSRKEAVELEKRIKARGAGRYIEDLESKVGQLPNPAV